MAIAIASDHAGFELKKLLVETISIQQLTIKDFGCPDIQSCDYPDYGHALARWVNAQPVIRKGILVCGTGIGMCMVANRYPNVRAALCHSVYDAEYARKHCDANVICLGARTTTAELAREFVSSFLSARFDGGRHERRVSKINEV